MQILLLGYKIKNAVQKSTPPEAKNFRDFHSQMQFSLNKLHFPDEKSASFSPAPSAPAKFSPPNPISVGGGQNGRFRRWWGAGPLRPPPNVRPWSTTKREGIPKHLEGAFLEHQNHLGGIFETPKAPRNSEKYYFFIKKLTFEKKSTIFKKFL